VLGLLPCVPEDDGVDAWLPLGVCVADPPWLADWLVVWEGDCVPEKVCVGVLRWLEDCEAVTLGVGDVR